MPEFRYAKGRILESIAYLTREMEEFETDYKSKTWQEYSSDSKLQKLIDRTIENILTSVIEVSGVILTEKNISAESYPDILKKTGEFFGYNNNETDVLSRFAVQRNRLAHRYLNFKWQVVRFYVEHNDILKRLINSIYEYEKSKQGGGYS